MELSISSQVAGKLWKESGKIEDTTTSSRVICRTLSEQLEREKRTAQTSENVDRLQISGKEKHLHNPQKGSGRG